ncbi:MAG: ABC-three component system middle component 6 [Capnocytophaga sp.]|uniref:ABC-three component system middle component 6 n=1 Tax=Capnocytophaga sp. TaxID=44737 RepID=UPI003F9F8DCA
MIVSKNISPQWDIYYLGAKLIELLDSSKHKTYDYYVLHKQFVKQYPISFNLFMLVLDWLFLLGIIKKAKKGEIVRCF